VLHRRHVAFTTLALGVLAIATFATFALGVLAIATFATFAFGVFATFTFPTFTISVLAIPVTLSVSFTALPIAFAPFALPFLAVLQDDHHFAVESIVGRGVAGNRAGQRHKGHCGQRAAP